jgi:cytochrome c peroxidase
MSRYSALAILAFALGLGTIGGAEPAKDSLYLKQSHGVDDPADLDEWRKSEERGGLRAYPRVAPGTPNPPGGVSQFGGSGPTSFGSVDLDEPFAAFRARMEAQRPAIDHAARVVLEQRYDLTCKTDSHVLMSRSKPQPLGPTARLPKAAASWETLAAQSPASILAADAFPYKPLDHPLHSTAHMVFPHQWTKVHPEHERFDVGFDIPECFLPEFPPPLYLTTHREMGDVTRGVEITYGNYFQMMNGVLTPEQLDGLRVLVTPFQTSWFNATSHRVVPAPSQGVTCFSCHVNGHANGAIGLAPDSRPNWARLRLDTPSLRGNYAFLIFSSKRAIRTLDHFAEVEEYFDGDTPLMDAIGARSLQKITTNHVGDFNAIIDFPPAPKLDVLNRLIPERATAAERRGEALFYGKARCSGCHPPETQFQDNSMHDLKVERFYRGRAEGAIKTFSLRGIKDSPPYLHDGRLLTLEDTVEFFNLILQTRLTAAEKKDLAAFLRAL